METSNIIQGRLRGRTDVALILEGNSIRYKQALESGALRIDYDPEGQPLEMRVGRHVQGFIEILNAYNEYYEDNAVIIDNLPTYTEILKKGIGYYLN